MDQADVGLRFYPVARADYGKVLAQLEGVVGEKITEGSAK